MDDRSGSNKLSWKVRPFGTEQGPKLVGECKVVTMGCRLNAFESEVIKGHIHRANLKNIIVINSCV